MIQKVYLKTKAGIDILVGLDAQTVIQEIEESDNTQPYIFNEDGVDVYMAVKNSSIQAPTFPAPGLGSSPDEYGTTSSELYAKVVTYPEIVSRIIQAQTKTKLTFMDQLKKIMALATPIVAVAFILFIMAVALKG